MAMEYVFKDRVEGVLGELKAGDHFAIQDFERHRHKVFVVLNSPLYLSREVTDSPDKLVVCCISTGTLHLWDKGRYCRKKKVIAEVLDVKTS